MSLRGALRALPTLLRVGFAESLAYRAEMFIWLLSTTMPFIMLALWTAVAREAPVGDYTSERFVGYFLAAFVVRQLTGAWAAWQINYEVRQGTLATRLLRPISPLWGYAAENLGAVPLRVVLTAPVLVLSLSLVGARALPQHAWGWAAFLLALVGGWCITFLANVAIGTLSLYMESSTKVMDVWIACFFVCSGYLYPLDVLPPTARAVLEWLPFPYQLGLPTELMTGKHDWPQALGLLARQWMWVGLMLLLCLRLWRGGLKRFGAFGG